MALSLTDRDKRGVIIGGGVVVLLLILVLVVFPLQDRLSTLNRQINSKQAALKESQQTSAELQQLRARMSDNESRFNSARSFSLFQYVQGVGNSLATPEQLAYIRPQPDQQQDNITISSLEARFQNLDLGQAVGILSRLENAPAVTRVTNLSIKKRFDRPEFLDVELKVSAYTQRTP